MIKNSEFRGNLSPRLALDATYYSNVRVMDTTFAGHTTAYPAEPTVAMIDQSNAVFERCTITGNVHPYSGSYPGSQISGDDCNLSFSHCLFFGNQGKSVARRYYNYFLNLDVANCTLAGNQGGQLDASTLTVTNSIVRERIYATTASISYSNLAYAAPGAGNITVNPLFVDAAGGDFSLADDSPCIDAGTNVPLTGPALNGVWQPSGAAFDMGAFEFVQEDDTDGDGISDAIEGVDDFDTDGTANYLDLDSDEDGLPDAEDGLGDIDEDGAPNFLDADSDDDGMTDGAEAAAGLNPNDPSDAEDDLDGDGLTAPEELGTYGTHPLRWDSDYDDMPDKWEIENGMNPIVSDATDDADADGLPNGYEFTLGTDPQDDLDPPSDLYVSPLGNDLDGLGTETAPWATLEQTMTVAGLYSAAEIYGLGSHPMTVHAGEGTYNEPLVFSDDITVAGAGQGLTNIVGLGDADGERFVVSGADACALLDCSVKLPGTHGFVTTLLRIDDVAMEVNNVEFVGNDNLFSIGLLINGAGSTDSMVENCYIRRLHYGIHAVDSGVAIANNTFENIYGDALFVRLPEEKDGDVAVPFLGDHAVAGSGNNTFAKVAGKFIVNATNTTVMAENNDWGCYTEAEILARMSGPVDVAPFIGQSADGSGGCHGSTGGTFHAGDVALLGVAIAALAALRAKRATTVR